MPEVTSDKHWHLDRKVPLGIIGAIILQTLALGMYAGSLHNRIATLELSQVQRSDERDRLITLETQMRGIHETLIRIERRMERAENDRRRQHP